MANVRDQIVGAALEHGARAVLSAPSLAARVVRVWVYVWLTPAALLLIIGLLTSHFSHTGFDGASAAFGLCGGALFLWFFPSMAATAVGMIIVAAFRYK